MPDLNELLSPKLTATAEERLNAAPPVYPQSNKVPYLGYFEQDDEPYDLTDYPEVRKRTLDNVAAAVNTRFPLESDKYILAVENLHYQDKDYTPQDEKLALLEGKTLGTRLKGDWVLYDKASGNVIDRRDNNTLVNVPYMTNRGVFIRSGNEYGLRNMFRLRPGMYTRIKGDGIIATHVNPAQGTGRQSNIMLSPTNGVFTWKFGTRNYGLLPLLLASGKSPEDIRAAWGDELFENNYKKYANIIKGKSKREAAEYAELWNDKLSKTLLDKDTTTTTLGQPFEKLTGDAVLAATNKILRVAQTYSDEETDDRDALQFQTIMGAADYLPERIVRDGGGMFRKLLNKIDKTGSLKDVPTGVFQPHVDAIFQEDRHAGYIDGASPIEALDFTTSLSRIGEGGLGTERAASNESRGVNNSYLGFVDPIRSVESQNVGLQVYATHGVKKDSRGRLWTKMLSKDGTPAYVDMDTISKGNVATPEYFDPKADPEEFIPAFRHGGDLEYMPRKDVDFYVADSSRMMSDNTGFIAGIGALRSNRTMLGSKASSQAMSLPAREAPLVRRYLPNEDGSDSTTEAYMGRKLGAAFADADGVVTRATDDEVIYRDRKGKQHKLQLYNQLPANNMGWLSQRPLVKEGDVITKGQPLVASNYTDDKGNAAIGVNLKVAMVSGPNAGTSLDAITISESAAKTKLASEQLYKTRTPVDNETVYDKQRFLKAFDTSDFTKDQLETIGDDGIVMPGTELHKGDPMVLAIGTREPGIKGVSKHPITPIVKTWEHDYPGTVMDIGRTNKNISIYTKAITPAKVGDKMCFDSETEILTGTRGWIGFKELTLKDTVWTMDPEDQHFELQTPTHLECYNYSGPMYHLETSAIDTFVTPNHRHVVKLEGQDHIGLEESSDIFGSPRWYYTQAPIGGVKESPLYVNPRADRYSECWEQYNGVIYCCTVPKYHTLYVRRNGKALWSGNSTVFGNKGIIGQILPDNEMLQDENGEPFEVYQSPLGLPSRVNPMVLGSLQLGKIAKATGKPVVWKDFSDKPMADTVMRMLQDHGLKESENLLDPNTGKTVPDVSTGYLYYLKFKHMGEKKEKARGTGDYTMEDLPLKGGENSARRFGSMEIGALFGHTGLKSEVMKDTKLIRGQANHDFWRAVRNGEAVPTPGIPLVHKKFFEHLRAAGVNLEDRGNRIHMYAATEPDVEKLTGNRQVQNNSTYDAKDLRPIQGGLFDPQIFGANGDQWAYYQLPEPILNPLMEKAVVSILGWKEKDFQGVLNGEQQINGKTGPEAIRDILGSLDLEKEFLKAQKTLKTEKLPALKRDKLLKRYRALAGILREHKNPQDLFLTRLPILPPKYRPVSVMGNDVGIVSDANYLYKAMIDAAQDFKDAQGQLPDEMLLDARKNLHESVKAVVGLIDSPDKKLQDKGVEGVLKWAFGKGSPKFGSLARKVFGATADLGGLAAISPDSRLGLDEVGLPEDGAWTAFEPFTVRNLRLRGYPLSAAMKEVQNRTAVARDALEEELKKRPVLVNRAPTLHKYNIMALWPKITKGNTIRYNPLIAKGMNSDHDGDSVANIVVTRTTQENLKQLLKNSETGVDYGISQPNKRVNTMIAKNSKVATHVLPLTIAEIPVIEGSETKKSETVTEWDCQPDWYVDTVDPATGETVCAEIKKISKHTGLKMYDVHIAESGAYKRVVTASEDHSLITLNPETLEFEKTTPKQSVGRAVPVVPYSTMNQAENCLSTVRIGKVVPLSYRLGEFIGAMLGDGWVDCLNKVRIAANCDDIRRHLIELTSGENSVIPVWQDSKDFEYSAKGSMGKQPKHRIAVYAAEDTARELKELIGAGAENKKIPWQSLCGSVAHLSGVLAGLLSTDGSVSCAHTKGKSATNKTVTYNTVSPYLRDGLQDLCRRLGIRTSVRAYRGKNSTMDCYAITLSCVDLKRFCDEHPKFRLFHEKSQKALEQIFTELTASKICDRKTIVPVPRVLRGELAFIGGPEYYNWSASVNGMIKAGVVSRDYALKLADKFDQADWTNYRDYGKDKHTPKQAQALANKWSALIRRTDIRWATITHIKESSCTEGWDMTIPGPYTFPLWDGTVVQDTMSFHVPVSRKAVQEAAERMVPSKNLLNPATLKAYTGVPMEEFSQGLYLASRPPKGKPIKFPSKEAMLQALRQGKITYDTAVEIPDAD